jgi:hypothetical protein
VAGPIRVDIEGLDQLAHDLNAIQQKLDGLGRGLGDYDAAIGAIGVRARLAEVAGNWSNARQRINQQMGQLAEMAASAAATYRATERAVSDASGSSRRNR